MFNINNMPVKACNIAKKDADNGMGTKSRKKRGDRQTRLQSMSHSIWKDGKHKYSVKFNKIYLKNINISFFLLCCWASSLLCREWATQVVLCRFIRIRHVCIICALFRNNFLLFFPYPVPTHFAKDGVFFFLAIFAWPTHTFRATK